MMERFVSCTTKSDFLIYVYLKPSWFM
jgi:hypothetical protein